MITLDTVPLYIKNRTQPIISTYLCFRAANYFSKLFVLQFIYPLETALDVTATVTKAVPESDLL